MKLNTDENIQTASEYQIMAIPTLLLFRDGQVAKRIQGAMPKKRLEAEIEPALRLARGVNRRRSRAAPRSSPPFPAAAVERHAHGERLLREVVLVVARGGEQLLVAAERQLDPVLDLQPGALARVLHRVDDLAREPLAAQLVVELEVERDGV